MFGVSFVGFSSPFWLGDALPGSWEGSGIGDRAFALIGLTSPEAGDTGDPGDLMCAGRSVFFHLVEDTEVSIGEG